MAKFDFNKPVASFSWYLQNGSADDKRGNRLHVGTGQKAQIYFDPESGEFIGKLKYVDDYIDLADGAKQHFELPRTAREYKPSDFSPKFPISNVKFEVDESVKDFIHVLPRGLFFYQNEFYDAVFGDKTDYPESLKDFLFTRTGDIEPAGEFYGAIEKWPQSVYCTLVEKCNVENRPIPEYENDRALPLDYHKELLASLKDYFGCGESNYRTPGDLIAARSYGSYLSGISLKFNPQDVIAAVEHATETVQAELVPYLSDSFGPDRYLPCGCQVDIPMNDSMVAASQLLRNLQNAGVDIGKLPNLSCDECSQLAAKVIPYAENKAQPAPDRTLGHKHEVNRDVAQRMQTERTTVNQIRIVKDDDWRDGMVEQVSGFMDKIKDMDAEEAEGADTVLAETFNSIDALSTDAAIDLLRVYSNCDASGRDAVAKTFYALSGESFDSYLMTASEVCKKTLGMLEPEPPQPAKTKNLSQKTMSSREASNRLSDEIGVKPCTRDEGTVGDS